MRRILAIFLFVLPFLMYAQEISVEKFYLAEGDQTANEHGTEQFDQNGKRCALIRIATTEKGFTFEGGSLGITKVDDNHTAEVWVYVPAGLRRITIHHPKLGNLYNYEFPVALQGGRTYIMTLITGKVRTVVEQDVGLQYLVLTVSPINAVVYIDNELKTLGSEGTLSVALPYGRHTYRVEASSYLPESGVVEIGQHKVKKSITLKSAKATLSITCTAVDAQIYVNEQLEGRGSATCSLDAGNYIVEVRKQGHRTQKQVVTLAVQEYRKLQLQAPEPIYGTLNINSNPPDAEVWLDGKNLGTSPDIFRNILAGNHELELRKQGYRVSKRTVTVTESKVENVNFTLEKGFSVDGEVFTVNGVSFVMKPVQGGTFWMGCASEHGSDCNNDEKPAHRVTLSSYYIGETEVTQALWKAVMGSNTSYFQGDNLPVEDVCWDDCQAFIRKLNQLTGQNFRLPTEAEWEFAARGGNKSRLYKYSGSNVIGMVSWYSGNSGNTTHPVKEKTPNELGLYDMSGNVIEWCQDWDGDYGNASQTNPKGPSTGSRRSARGGNWGNEAGWHRVTSRGSAAPYYRGKDSVGFRLALSAE